MSISVTPVPKQTVWKLQKIQGLVLICSWDAQGSWSILAPNTGSQHFLLPHTSWNLQSRESNGNLFLTGEFSWVTNPMSFETRLQSRAKFFGDVSIGLQVLLSSAIIVKYPTTSLISRDDVGPGECSCPNRDQVGYAKKSRMMLSTEAVGSKWIMSRVLSRSFHSAHSK